MTRIGGEIRRIDRNAPRVTEREGRVGTAPTDGTILYSTAYADQHPDRIWCHCGGGRWRNSIPDLGKITNKTQIRLPFGVRVLAGGQRLLIRKDGYYTITAKDVPLVLEDTDCVRVGRVGHVVIPVRAGLDEAFRDNPESSEEEGDGEMEDLAFENGATFTRPDLQTMLEGAVAIRNGKGTIADVAPAEAASASSPTPAADKHHTDPHTIRPLVNDGLHYLPAASFDRDAERPYFKDKCASGSNWDRCPAHLRWHLQMMDDSDDNGPKPYVPATADTLPRSILVDEEEFNLATDIAFGYREWEDDE